MIKLRHYQAGAAPAVIKYLIQGKGKRPLIALPTGAGKSYVIGDLVKRLSKNYNILVLSHVKEIIAQNVESIKKYSGIKVGTYSAGLGKKELFDVTVAGIQSAYNKKEIIKKYDMIIVDECHRISPEKDSMYQKLFKAMGEDTIIIGLTATPYRLGYGPIYGEKRDFDLVYDWCTKEKFVQLVDEGFLAPLVTEGTGTKMDTEGVKKTAGDFNEKALSDKFDREHITEAILDEVVAGAADRKHWMVFAIDQKHAEHIAESLNRRGILTAVVHSKMAEIGFDRDKVVQGVKDGLYRCVVNVNILTTGYDHPGTDYIALMRPTESPVMHTQIMGRGSRICEGKVDCLIHDFAGNLARLGPINDVLVKVKGEAKGNGEPMMKECPKCNLMVHAAARKCSRCGFVFPREHGLSVNASAVAAINDGKAKWINVDSVEYTRVHNIGRPSIFMTVYKCSGLSIKEPVCIEHRGFAQHKAMHWCKVRGVDSPRDVEDLFYQRSNLATPKRIRASKKGAYYTIHDVEF